jgi:hypothetical protein
MSSAFSSADAADRRSTAVAIFRVEGLAGNVVEQPVERQLPIGLGQFWEDLGERSALVLGAWRPPRTASFAVPTDTARLVIAALRIAAARSDIKSRGQGNSLVAVCRVRPVVKSAGRSRPAHRRDKRGRVRLEEVYFLARGTSSQPVPRVANCRRGSPAAPNPLGLSKPTSAPVHIL